MTQQLALYIIAVIVVGLIFIVPQILAFRIRLLHWLRWHRLADWHQRNIRILIPVFRAVLLVIATVLFLTGARVL
jgi:hypothetical protein